MSYRWNFGNNGRRELKIRLLQLFNDMGQIHEGWGTVKIIRGNKNDLKYPSYLPVLNFMLIYYNCNQLQKKYY